MKIIVPIMIMSFFANFYSKKLNCRDSCSSEDSDLYICSGKENIHFKNNESSSKNKFNKNRKRIINERDWDASYCNNIYPTSLLNYGGIRTYPLSYQYRPICSPLSCLPQPLRNLKISNQSTNLQDVKQIFESLLNSKKAELSNAIIEYVKSFVEEVKIGLLQIQWNLNDAILQLNNTLLNSMTDMLNNTNSDVLKSVINEVTKNNNIFLVGVNSLISSSNAAVESYLKSLALLPSATIVADIQNLTTITGTLQQILAIISTISTGSNNLYTTQTQNMASFIGALFSAQEKELSNLITSAINVYDIEIAGSLEVASNQYYGFIVVCFKKLIEDLTFAFTTIIQNYQRETNTLVVEYFSTQRCPRKIMNCKK